ncbi:hypothetical protein E2562_023137 [Oryza meyeriana var. granulata]|uniref:Uncharacterized protein n=1 Tax=Oryza meyeriana var. granulata TaxID=110450 RepID=A0A6G1E132_9ORYZ|nr:hypothetical protein E2562_023137 [Oryza meyeriana var. granulata]
MAAASLTLEASVDATLDALRGDQWRLRQPFTIFRVPAYVRDSNRTAYEPRLVSIGPYYHGGAALRAMEDHKWRYLQDLLRRRAGDGVAVVTASDLVAEMRALEAQARACYGERPAGLGSDDFIRMLLLDGCFILEFFFKWHTKEPDALCDVGWGLTLVAADLLLMENQIPFFVLERLYDVVAGAQGGRESLLNLFVEYISEDEPIRRPSGDWEVHHLLHLYYECFVPKRPRPTESARKAPAAATRTILRASELREAGVAFVRRSNARDRFDVTFDGRRGVMEIPAIEIDDMKRPLLINLIAFEQTQAGEQPRLLTSYVALMGQLIVTARDVELLRRRGVLESLLADDEEAARFFSRLGEGAAMDLSRQAFAGLYEDVRRYCASWWHRNRAALRRDYFASPWSAISVVVAAVVVFLAATQTYFTVFPAKN